MPDASKFNEHVYAYIYRHNARPDLFDVWNIK